MSERLNRIWAFVEEVHQGQLYAGLPYREGHLEGVKGILAEAGLNGESDEVIAATHDAIEDAKDDNHRMFVFDWLKANLTEFEFRMTWALTGIGKNRKERNADAKRKIAADPPAANYKLADRLFNWEQARLNGKPQEAMYRREDTEFYEAVVVFADNQYLVNRYERLSGRE
jgi:hypothetical protein